MRTLLLLAFLVSFNISFAQKVKWDTSISFTRFGNRWLSESRVVPNGSKSPLYLAISYQNDRYENTGHLHYEYFRVDSAHYLFQEYFSNADADYYDGLKSSGVKAVQSIAIPDTILVDKFNTAGEKLGTVYMVQYRKNLTKEGEWIEYEDSTRNPVYRKGNYDSDKRAGLWKRLFYDFDREIIIEEVDFDKDSTKKIYPENIANTISADLLKKMLPGARWLVRNNEIFDKGSTASYYRCIAPFGQLCGDNEAYYRFDPSGDFIRNIGRMADATYNDFTRGKWELTKTADEWLITITFTNGRAWQFKLLYLDKNYRFLTQRM